MPSGQLTRWPMAILLSCQRFNFFISLFCGLVNLSSCHLVNFLTDHLANFNKEILKLATCFFCKVFAPWYLGYIYATASKTLHFKQKSVCVYMKHLRLMSGRAEGSASSFPATFNKVFLVGKQSLCYCRILEGI